MTDALKLAQDALTDCLPTVADGADHETWTTVRGDHLRTVLAALDAPADTHGDWSLLDATQESLREHMAEIHTLREAAQQAINAMDALRAALAQQPEPAA